MSTDLAPYWPPFGLRIACGPLMLRVPRDEDLVDLTELLKGGLRPAGLVPFNDNFDDVPEPRRTREAFQHYWKRRATMTPEAWTLDLAVIRDGTVVGIQEIRTTDYQLTRTGESGSWLGLAHQGQGTGTLMRQALAALMFDHLGAREIATAAFEDNAGSLGVSRKVGYRENGTRLAKRADGTAAHMRRFVLTPDTFVRPPQAVMVDGADAFAEYVGLGPQHTA